MISDIVAFKWNFRSYSGKTVYRDETHYGIWIFKFKPITFFWITKRADNGSYQNKGDSNVR